jgi:glutathione peroxidase
LKVKKGATMSTSLYNIEVTDINGQKIPLSNYKNKVLLVVNVASKCGFTPQYKELEELYREYSKAGLEILAFPCNQFGAQEPGDADEIKKFCSLNYDITFPMFAKIDVNGDNASPLFEYLKTNLPGVLGTKAIKWNFTKFLIDRNGLPRVRYAPTDTPSSIKKDIVSLL